MARKLRMVGSGSGNDGCPTLYQLDPDQYVVQGDVVTDPDEIAQLDRLKEGEAHRLRTAVTAARLERL